MLRSDYDFDRAPLILLVYFSVVSFICSSGFFGVIFFCFL